MVCEVGKVECRIVLHIIIADLKRRGWVMRMIMRLGAVIIFVKQWWNDASDGVESYDTAVAGSTRQNHAEVFTFFD